MKVQYVYYFNLARIDYYSYFCECCKIETNYCFPCNKSIDFLLNSIFFKCVKCVKLVRITKRNTYYCNKNNENKLFGNLFMNKEEALLLNINPIQTNIDKEPLKIRESLNFIKEQMIAYIPEENKNIVIEEDKVHIEAEKPKRGKFTFIRNFNLDEYLKNNIKKEPENEKQPQLIPLYKNEPANNLEIKPNLINKENTKQKIINIIKPSSSIFAGYNKTENSKKILKRINPRLHTSISSNKKLNQSYDSIYDTGRYLY